MPLSFTAGPVPVNQPYIVVDYLPYLLHILQILRFVVDVVLFLVVLLGIKHIYVHMSCGCLYLEDRLLSPPTTRKGTKPHLTYLTKQESLHYIYSHYTTRKQWRRRAKCKSTERFGL